MKTPPPKKPDHFLIVCRSQSEMAWLDRLPRRSASSYIVASDDLRVHQEIRKGVYPWVQEVCWLERMESLHRVSAQVLQLLDVVNHWLQSLGDGASGIPQELLFWPRHCEGGWTTQRLQDLLLLMRSALHLLESYDITGIIVLSHPGAEFEDDIWREVGQSRGIATRVMGRFRPRVLRARWLASLKNLAREPYYLVSVFRSKWRNRHLSGQLRRLDREIVFQLCSGEAKHVENIVPLMQALKSKGYHPVALLWMASQATENLRQAGLSHTELETLVPVSSLWQTPRRVWQTWKQASHRRKELWAHPDLRYQGVRLGPLIWPSIRFFLLAELAPRHRLWLAAQRYFSRHTPQGVKLWGGGVLPEGAILRKSLPDQPRPLSLNWFWACFENPYESDLGQIDLLLASGRAQRDYFRRHGVPADRIALVGMSRYDHLKAFRQEYGPRQSRARLGIPPHFFLHLLFDPNVVIRGYLTAREQSLVTYALLEFAQKHPEMALLIKPHPSHHPGFLEALIDDFSLQNVFLIDKNMLSYHPLNAADLLITKFSTLALEAMLLETPVISVVLDQEEHFKVFGNAVEYVDTIAALHDLLWRLANNAEHRMNWTAKQMALHRSFLKYFLEESTRPAAQLGAEIIDQRLKAKFH